MKKRLLFFLFLALPFCLAQCDDDSESGGEGQLQITTWGEEYIEEGIPSGEFEDGWSVHYDSFLVSIRGITRGEGSLGGSLLVDLVKKGPHTLVLATLPEGAVGSMGYSIAPDAQAENLNLTETQRQLMVDNGYSLYVSGTATKGEEELSFAWGFDLEAHYTACEAQGTISADATAEAQLTIHGDHLFYESLTNPEAGLRFQVVADCDTNDDGEVTQVELEAFSGVDFTSLDNYDVPAGSGIDSLWTYLKAQAATVGHIDGEGHCHME